MNIPGVPDSIPWAPVAAFLESLGIDLDNVSRDGIRINWDSIEATVFATTHLGHHFVDHTLDAAAVHHIHIPITHDEQPDQASKD